MKLMGLMLLGSLVLISSAIGASDEEIKGYALGVFDSASIGGKTTISFNSSDGHFNATSILSNYSNSSTEDVGYIMLKASMMIDKIVKRYPEDVKYESILIRDAKGHLKGFAYIYN